MRSWIVLIGKNCIFIVLFALLCAVSQPAKAQTTTQPASAQNGFVAGWLARASKTQSEQPHWITPVVLVTPRLEQEFRTDFTRQLVSGGYQVWTYGNGKGLELIPARRVELLFNIPPYVTHSEPNTPDGFGDTTMLMKFRILSANEKKGNYILTAFFGGSIPTGSHKNGSGSATLLPTIAGGKGWGRFDLESTLGGTLPVNSTEEVGRSIAWNSVAQYHLGRYVWPELESNSTFYKGGEHDGKTQNFLTPGLVIGRIPLHHRVGLTFGAGMQIATSNFYTSNHILIFSGRIPF
ncbi:MAG TPA: hypothetical protein VHX63_12155 [Acidobacteriaceae bacterium]|jgi:hypothetical protein|nr:hypothetical protein [Acidobacteriaceae bacterium]